MFYVLTSAAGEQCRTIKSTWNTIKSVEGNFKMVKGDHSYCLQQRERQREPCGVDIGKGQVLPHFTPAQCDSLMSVLQLHYSNV